MIQQHLAHATLVGLRPRSLQARAVVLRSFANHIHPKSLASANRRDVESFLSRPLSPASRCTYLGHLRSLYRWAVEAELIAEDPTAKVKVMSAKRGTPHPLSAADLATALENAGPRMRAWLLLMSFAGLRCCEVSKLRPGDLLEGPDGSLLLYLRETKGGTTATVPAHPAVVDALIHLPITDGEWWSVNANGISGQVSRYLHGLGINASAHHLRHTFASSALEVSGYDLLTTSRLMRHANVNNTQIYAAINPARPAEVVNLLPVPRTERQKPPTKWTPVIQAYGQAMQS
jgi:integrase